MQKGKISIHAQNIMPVIKRWLYSDKDIFIREMVSNGCDAITKYKLLHPESDEDFRVTVEVDPEKSEIRFMDNGIGMTEEEVKKYINQVAFSSAEEFLKNYTGEDTSGIIGHFGLGFYSAFIASDLVTIDTLSSADGAEPVFWRSADGMSFTMETGTRENRGTTITLHIAEDEKEFLQISRVREILEKYCGYMSVPIYLVDLTPKAPSDENKEEEKTEKEEPKPLNDTHPLWLKKPADCTEEEYKATFRKLFHTYEDPLFWVHLNVDYPFNLKGILYFPRIRRNFGGQEGEIKLFNRQVFVADNIKEVIPEFLMLLKGAIDCPDLPLNVSRSFLQNDGYVRRLSAHITKKVADKLNSLFSTERKTYETYWDDIHPFVKYGCIRDEKFFEQVKNCLLLKTTGGEYLTLDEYKTRNEGKTDKKIYYTTEPNRQAVPVSLYTDKGIDVAILDTLIDLNFISFMEMNGGLDGTVFARVDAATEGLTSESEEGKSIHLERMKKLFQEVSGDETMEVKLDAFSDTDMPLMLLEDEQMRRYREMSLAYGNNFSFPAHYTLVLNRACPTIQKLSAMKDRNKSLLIARQLYDLSRMSGRPLEAEDLKAFLKRSNQLVAAIAGVKDAVKDEENASVAPGVSDASSPETNEHSKTEE